MISKEEIIKLLGKIPDSEVAARSGLTRRKICELRHKENIPAFIGLILTQEGLPCRSIYEARYDAYLHWKRITHQHEIPQLGGLIVSDFIVENSVVEIAGMSGFNKYKIRMGKKISIYKDNNIDVRWVYPSEVNRLYSDCPIEIRFRSGRKCSDCDTGTHDLVKGVCRKCYMKRWHIVAPIKTCLCGNKITRDVSKFCSHACYASSLELTWPSWDVIDSLLVSNNNVSEVARLIGVSPNALHMKLRRRSLRRH